MALNLDEMVVRSHPGEGLVGRFAGVVLVAVPSAPAQDAMLDQLLALAEEAATTGPTPGRRLARQIAGVLSASDPDVVPAFGLLAQADTGLVLILHGAMDAEISGPQGNEHLSGGQVATWVDRILPPPIVTVVVAPSGGAPSPHPRSRLVAGIVSGSGISLLPAAAGRTAPSPEPPAPAPPAATATPGPAAPARRPTLAPAEPAPPPAAPAAPAAPAVPTPPAAPAWPAPTPAPPPAAAPAPPAAAASPAAPAAPAAPYTPAPPAPPVAPAWPPTAPAPAPAPAPPAPAPPAPAPPAPAPPAPVAVWPPLAADPAGVPAGASPVDQEEPTVVAGTTPPPAPAAPEPAPAGPRPFIAVALAEPQPGPQEVRAPLLIAGQAPHKHEEPSGPRVRGVICSRGHFNDPSAPFCSACGISMVQRTLNLVEGPRPPLGVIVLDDGTTFTLDSDYVVGREPEGDPAVLTGQARPLPLSDPDRTVSRVHAGLIIDGWSVKAVDLGSANGTFVAASGEDEWVALIPNRPTVVKPGTRIRLGQRVFLFDSHQGTR